MVVDRPTQETNTRDIAGMIGYFPQEAFVKQICFRRKAPDQDIVCAILLPSCYFE